MKRAAEHELVMAAIEAVKEKRQKYAFDASLVTQGADLGWHGKRMKIRYDRLTKALGWLEQMLREDGKQ